MTTAVSTPTKSQKEKSPLAKTCEPLADFGFAPLTRLRQEFDGLWNKFLTEMPALWNAERNDLRWSFDIVDEPAAYIVKAEAPGFDIQDFAVELRGEQLVLQARKSTEKKEKEEESFTSTEFYRTMTIPQHIAKDKIEASYRNGVLEVRLPKTAEAQGQKIDVKP